MKIERDGVQIYIWVIRTPSYHGSRSQHSMHNVIEIRNLAANTLNQLQKRYIHNSIP
jgi:hypothetical protein